MSNKLIPGDRVVVDAGLGITKTGNVQRITESTVFVKHYNGAVVGYRTQHVTKMLSEEVSAKPRGVGLKSEFDAFMQVMEKTLTPAELKKREEVAKAMERENPDMPMDKKMAIATATAKKVAEEAKPHTVPKTAKEKSLAALAEPKDKITHADVMVGRGVKKEELEQADEAASWNPIKHIPKEKQNDAIKTAAKDVKRGSYADRAALLRAGGVKQEEISTAQMGHAGKTTIKHIKNPTVTQRMAAHDVKPGVAGYRDRIALLKAAQAQGNLKEEDVHYCAKHVFSERFGEGMVVEGQHAEPNEQGLIEWYDVDFGGQVRRVMTEKVKVMHAEYHMNHKKKMKEEDEIELDEEQLDELNKDTLISYQDKADADITRKHRVLGPQIKAGDAKAANKTSNTIGKRMAGIDRAVERLNKEEVDLDEAAAGHTMEAHGVKGMKSTPWRKSFKSHEHAYDWAEKNDAEIHGTRDLERAKKGNPSPAMREEVELDEGRKAEKDDHEPHPSHGHIGLSKGDVRDTAYKEGLRHAAGNKHGSNAKAWGPEAKHYSAGFMAGRNDADTWHKNMSKITRTEDAEINEAETGNLPGSRTHIMNKDVRHPEHGIISNGTVLRHTGGNNFEVRAGRAKGKIVNIPKEHVNKLDEEVDLDEARNVGYHHKGSVIWHDDLADHKERHQTVLRLHKNLTKLGYSTKNKEHLNLAHHEKTKNNIRFDNKDVTYTHPSKPSKTVQYWTDHPNRQGKRTHVVQVVNTPKKANLPESVELGEAMISYSDFQSKIDSHRKAGNQIKDDKYDKKKASYTVVDQEGTAKKITHTDAGVSQQHLGSMKRDDSDDKSAETKPKETRGRGRPAGSKSGARN